MVVRRKDVLAALERGDVLMVTHPDPFRVEKKSYALRGGGAVASTTFMALYPRLEPVGDGLFGASQTYRLK